MLSAVLCGIIGSCSKDDLDFSIDPKNLKRITSFEFLAEYNQALSQNVKAEIDSVEQTINAEVPFGTDITSLSPTVGFILGGERSQIQGEAQNFSELVHYKTYGKDSLSLVYCITVVPGKSNEKRINSFQFLASDHEFLDEDFECQIDEQAKTIAGELPLGSDLSALKPSVSVSQGAKVELESGFLDFSEALTVKVIADDGSEESYTANLSVEIDERQVLIDLYNANPDNILPWDVGEKDLSKWEDVALNPNGKIDTLWINDRRLTVLPRSMGDLKHLTYLNANRNSISEVPKEIGKLSNLRELYLIGNELNTASFPTELSNLKSLKELVLSNNPFTEVPEFISKLKNLEYLGISDNPNLNRLPENLAGLTNLKGLGVLRNKFDQFPSVILELSNLEFLALSGNPIGSVPLDIGKLTKLTYLSLSDCRLTELPREMGNLTSLETLFIFTNQITLVPKEICDLDIEDFRKDETAICEE